MKCLVTGATGFIGRALCAQLRADGHEVVPLSCSGASLDDGTPTIAIDIATGDFDSALFGGVNVVIHAAGIAHQNAAPDEYVTVNTEATVRLYRAACSASVPTFIYVSSVKAMGVPTTGSPRSESELAPAPDPYGSSKREAEKALEAEAGACTSLLIVRPSLVYGREHKGNLHLLARGVRLGLPRPPPGGLRSMIALPDMVGLLCTLAVRPPAGCRTFIATGPDVYSTRQIYDLLRRAEGRPPGRAWWPAWVWRLAGRALDVVRGRAAGTTYEIMFGDEVYDGSAVTAALGWSPRVRLEDVLGVASNEPLEVG